MYSHHICTQFNIWSKTKEFPSFQYPKPQIPAIPRSTEYNLPSGRQGASEWVLVFCTTICKVPPGETKDKFWGYIIPFHFSHITSLSCFWIPKSSCFTCYAQFYSCLQQKIIPVPNNPLWPELEVYVFIFNTCINGKLQFFAEMLIHLLCISPLGGK